MAKDVKQFLLEMLEVLNKSEKSSTEYKEFIGKISADKENLDSIKLSAKERLGLKNKEKPHIFLRLQFSEYL